MHDWIRGLPPAIDLRALVADLEKVLIDRALAQAGGVQAEAARSLGLSRSDIGYRVSKYRSPAG